MGKLYGTDMSDAAWALVEPHLPASMPGGRPRMTCLRSVVDAIFYLLRTGCQWRLLPREFPPRRPRPNIRVMRGHLAYTRAKRDVMSRSNRP
jgi:transposase